MTVIAAVLHPRYVAMGSDKQIVDGWIKHHSGTSKIVRREGWLFGTTGPVRVNNAIKTFDPPAVPDDMTEAWVSKHFVPSLVTAMDKTKLAIIEGWLGGKEPEQQGTILCACLGGIFTVQADWAIDFWAEDYAAIGSGQKQALGAFYAAGYFHQLSGASPRDIINVAIKAAAASDIFCACDGQPDFLMIERDSNAAQEIA